MEGLRNKNRIKAPLFIVSLLSGLIILCCISELFSLDKQSSVRVFCYHSFVGSSNRYSFSHEELDSHIQILLKKGYSFLTPSEFIEQTYTGNNNILITIDDGHRSVYDTYWKVLKKYNILPVLAIYPAVIGRAKHALTWEQLRELADEGCYIASHGYSHFQLDDSFCRDNEKTRDREIIASKKILEDKLKLDVDIFVYPYGVYCDRAVAALGDAGYSYAFSVDDYMVTPSRVASGALTLPRYMLTRHNSLAFLKKMPSSAVAAASPEDEEIKLIPYYKKIELSGKKLPDADANPFINRISHELVQPGLDYIKKKISPFTHSTLFTGISDADDNKEIVPVHPDLDIIAIMNSGSNKPGIEKAVKELKKAVESLFYGSTRGYNRVLGYCNTKVNTFHGTLSSFISKDSLKRYINKSIPLKFKTKYFDNK